MREPTGLALLFRYILPASASKLVEQPVQLGEALDVLRRRASDSVVYLQGLIYVMRVYGWMREDGCEDEAVLAM